MHGAAAVPPSARKLGLKHAKPHHIIALHKNLHQVLVACNLRCGIMDQLLPSSHLAAAVTHLWEALEKQTQLADNVQVHSHSFLQATPPQHTAGAPLNTCLASLIPVRAQKRVQDLARATFKPLSEKNDREDERGKIADAKPVHDDAS